MKTGIYQITNTTNGHCYIGQARDIKKRWQGHKDLLRKGKHSNHLQRAFNKYGEESFVFKVLLYCEPDELTRYEQGIVNYLHPEYNTRLECTKSNAGIKFSEETRKKMGLAHIGKRGCLGFKHTEETKKKVSEAGKGNKRCLGYKHTEETKKRMSAAGKGKSRNVGRKMPEEQKKKMSEQRKGTHVGHVVTQEARDKISKANKGKKRSEEFKKKISERMKGNNLFSGHTHSEEAKKKVSQSLIGNKRNKGNKKVNINQKGLFDV